MSSTNVWCADEVLGLGAELFNPEAPEIELAATRVTERTVGPRCASRPRRTITAPQRIERCALNQSCPSQILSAQRLRRRSFGDWSAIGLVNKKKTPRPSGGGRPIEARSRPRRAWFRRGPPAPCDDHVNTRRPGRQSAGTGLTASAGFGRRSADPPEDLRCVVAVLDVLSEPSTHQSRSGSSIAKKSLQHHRRQTRSRPAILSFGTSPSRCAEADSAKISWFCHGIFAPPRYAPSRSAPRRYAPRRYAPPRFAPPRSAPPRFAPPRFAPPRSAPRRSAPPRYAPPRFAPPRFAPPRSAPRRSAPPRFAPRGSPRRGPPRGGPPRRGSPRRGSPRRGPPRGGRRPSGDGLDGRRPEVFRLDFEEHLLSRAVLDLDQHHRSSNINH